MEMNPARRRLRFFANLNAIESLPGSSAFAAKRDSFDAKMEALQGAGFNGVQFDGTPAADHINVCSRLGLGIASSGRVNTPEDALPLAQKLADAGCACATLHVGSGLEDDAEASLLIESVLGASERCRMPLYIETHRATILQDMWRSVQFISRFPEMRINGDFSHWYAGQEMVYGGFEKKLAFIAPVIERVRFLHGRIASPGCIQVAVDAEAVEQPLFVQHFEQLWTESFRAFLRHSEPVDEICFAPELLGPEIYYARSFRASGAFEEESDRWQQSLLLNQIAQRCFDRASLSVPRLSVQ